MFLAVSSLSLAQNSFDYSVSLQPVSIPSLPGFHSFTYAQHNGKWLVIGGRRDGLHARQPFASFPESGNNTDIFVIDVNTQQFWSKAIASLPTSLQEQLQSTNMNFFQGADTLYIIGGYAYSATSAGHITYPYLTTVHVSGLMDAVINDQPITSYFKQIQNDLFAVSGGHLENMRDTFYLVGGHRFDGSYNPMGNPTYTQTYTNKIQKFTVNNSGAQLSYGNYSAITDPVHLHRRDYNLLPQIFPNGEEGFTISSGVFQLNADLPFLYPVDITSGGYTPVTSFNQYLSNYHSAVACMFDSTLNEMHSLFFGGMSRYYYSNGNLIQDDNVPFVKTISRLTRDSNGNLTEYQLPVEMPALKGASAEFIYNLSLPHYESRIVKLSQIQEDSILVGHILGGLLSPTLNPFSNNQTSTTSPDNSIYEVWLVRNNPTSGMQEIDGSNPYDVTVFPNPTADKFKVNFRLDKAVTVSYFVTDASGKIVAERYYPKLKGKQTLTIDVSDEPAQTFLCNIVFDEKFFVTKQILKN